MFQVARDSLTYLGIKITPKINDLVHANYSPTINSVVDLINRWSMLPISLIGGVNILKMNVLPKFLYLFQAIPLSPPDDFFTKAKTIFIKFIWNNRRARLCLSLLYLPYDRGGLCVPNLKWYYWAAQLSAASCWFSTTTLPWVNLERTSTTLPLSTYLYSAKYKDLMKDTPNLFVKNTIRVWFDALKFKNETPALSQLSPFWGNRAFKPGWTDLGFKMWAVRGLCKVADLFDKDTLLCFNGLTQKFGIPTKRFFKFLKIRSFISKTQKSLTLPTLNSLEDIAINHQLKKGLISRFYSNLRDGSQTSSEKERLTCCQDLECRITIEEWKKSLLESPNTIYKHPI